MRRMPDEAMLALPAPQLGMSRASGLAFLTDERLFEACGIRIGFTTRHGGVSEGPYASLNLGAHTADSPSCVEENRRIVSEALGVPQTRFVCPKQVHGDRIVVVSDASQLAAAQEDAARGADGILVTCSQAMPLLCFADCVPVIIVSAGGFALVHAGWRGVVARIAPKAVEMLVSEVPGLAPDSINVYLGPHIQGCCFETSEELHASFVEGFGPAASAGPRHVDLSGALIASLVEVGIAPERILDAETCTACGNDDFFSYRVQDGDCGRHAAFCFGKDS